MSLWAADSIVPNFPAWPGVDTGLEFASMQRGKAGEKPIERGWAAGWGIVGPASILGPALLLGLLACATDPPKPSTDSEAPQALESASPGFSGTRASADLAALVATGSRRPGSASAARAAKWIEGELVGLGARVELWSPDPPSPESAHGPIGAVVGILEGESDDPVLLLARYDTLPGERDGGGPRNSAAAAGAAVVLELGRVLAESPRPYSIWLVFIEGDGTAPPVRLDRGGAGDSASLRFPGSDAVASELAARKLIGRTRLAIFFGSLPGPSLVVERDLRSHRIYRESFWRSAEALGARGIFPPTDTFSSPQTGHLALLTRGLRPTVALVGASGASSPARGGSGSPGPAPPHAVDLDGLGRVSLEAMDRIARRLRRIDSFSKAPLGDESLAPPRSDSDFRPPAPPTPQVPAWP